jgi:hypothetical protein
VHLLQKDDKDIRIASSQVLESVSWDDINDVRNGKHTTTLSEVMQRAAMSCDELFYSLANALGRQDAVLRHKRAKVKHDEGSAAPGGWTESALRTTSDLSRSEEEELCPPPISPSSTPSLSTARLRVLTRNLSDAKLETRINAARSWSQAIDSAETAQEAAQNIDAFRNMLSEKKSVDARRAGMAAFCAILAHGQTSHCCAEVAVNCLSDLDGTVQRRAAICCKLLAEKGCSEALVPHLSTLVATFAHLPECQEPLLQALSTMARKGNAMMVARKVLHSSVALESLAKLVQSNHAGLIDS